MRPKCFDDGHFDGTDTTHFGRWQENDFIEFKAAYKF